MICGKCGGCQYQGLKEDYQKSKEEGFKKILGSLHQAELKFNEPLFVGEGCRRRAAFAFIYSKKKLTFGFNEYKSAEINDIDNCPLLTEKINDNLQVLKKMVLELCHIMATKKIGKKLITQSISSGDVLVCEVDNGLDIVLEVDVELNIEHRMIISEFIQNNQDIIRISHRKDNFIETLIEKIKPFIKIGNTEVYIAAGTFLQASKMAQEKMVDLVKKYLFDTNGNIADLFCGIGTFSIPLAENINNKITAADSSKELLMGFQETLKKNQIKNIKIFNKNLFKYPFDEKELEDFSALVIDPPRAGASAQISKINNVPKIVMVSCNPHSFIKDANELISKGYKIEEITLIDQFVYSNHNELVALFTI